MESPLFKLPFELRQGIYEYLFQGKAIHAILDDPDMSHEFLVTSLLTPDISWNLLSTCSTIRREVEQYIRFSHLVVHIEYGLWPDNIAEDDSEEENPLWLDKLLVKHIPAIYRAHVTTLLVERVARPMIYDAIAHDTIPDQFNMFSKNKPLIKQSLPSLKTTKPVITERTFEHREEMLDLVQTYDPGRIDSDPPTAIQQQQRFELAKAYQDNESVERWCHRIYTVNPDASPLGGGFDERRFVVIEKIVVLHRDQKLVDILDELVYAVLRAICSNFANLA